jgi:hypothetical protein
MSPVTAIIKGHFVNLVITRFAGAQRTIHQAMTKVADRPDWRFPFFGEGRLSFALHLGQFSMKSPFGRQKWMDIRQEEVGRGETRRPIFK